MHNLEGLMHPINFEKLKNWFLNEKRDLAWRNQPTPYAVWISEVMLQQTQVTVVAPYFDRWMERFPTIKNLAEANLDEVIKLWEGLGYYSRARSLHEGARYLVEYHRGELPNNEEGLSKIKGLGPYTVGAILSFAFKKRAAAVDGNVIRVLTRYLEIKDDISKNKTVNQLRKIALNLLPEDESWIQNEALIELGATVCKKQPNCIACPLRSDCKGYSNGSAGQLPFKSTKSETHYLYRAVPILNCGNKLLIRRGEKGKIMSDLHEFPYFETLAEGWTEKRLQQEIIQKWALEIKYDHTLENVNHSFTKYQVLLRPVIFHCIKEQAVKDHAWILIEDLKKLAFSSGHRRIFNSYLLLAS